MNLNGCFMHGHRRFQIKEGLFQFALLQIEILNIVDQNSNFDLFESCLLFPVDLGFLGLPS